MADTKSASLTEYDRASTKALVNHPLRMVGHLAHDLDLMTALGQALSECMQTRLRRAYLRREELGEDEDTHARKGLNASVPVEGDLEAMAVAWGDNKSVSLESLNLALSAEKAPAEGCLRVRQASLLDDRCTHSRTEERRVLALSPSQGSAVTQDVEGEWADLFDALALNARCEVEERAHRLGRARVEKVDHDEPFPDDEHQSALVDDRVAEATVAVMTASSDQHTLASSDGQGADAGRKGRSEVAPELALVLPGDLDGVVGSRGAEAPALWTGVRVCAWIDDDGGSVCPKNERQCVGMRVRRQVRGADRSRIEEDLRLRLRVTKHGVPARAELKGGRWVFKQREGRALPRVVKKRKPAVRAGEVRLPAFHAAPNRPQPGRSPTHALEELGELSKVVCDFAVVRGAPLLVSAIRQDLARGLALEGVEPRSNRALSGKQAPATASAFAFFITWFPPMSCSTVLRR